VSSLAELPAVLHPTDTVEVRLTGRRRIAGRFVGATATDLTIAVDGQAVTLPVGEVQEVKVRWRRMWRRGMLLGALSGAGVGATLVLLDAETDEDRGWAVAGMMMGGSVGLGLGTLFGTFAFDRPLVYTGPSATVAVIPAVSPTRAGVRIAIAF
jgi:hypothetical protein